ncbi:MAG TPA: hypothetical protein VKE22_07520 [Haliangiales bacterium]|nr:hypothetical protein [Haliangiales bacterium]
MMLLTGAGLTIGSFLRLQRVSPGFDPTGVTVAEISLPDGGYEGDAQRVGFYRRLDTALAALPGADGAAVAVPAPFSGSSFSFTLDIAGRSPVPPGQQPAAQFRSVGPGYLRAMRIPLLAGRGLTPADDDPAASPSRRAGCRRGGPAASIRWRRSARSDATIGGMSERAPARPSGRRGLERAKRAADATWSAEPARVSGRQWTASAST